MKLQLALDLVDIPGAKQLVKEVEPYIDIVEIATPVVINKGMKKNDQTRITICRRVNI